MTNQGNSQPDSFVDETLGGVRQQVEGHIGQVIDQYASRVPGGERFTPEAKQAVSGVLDGLQKQLENEAANRLGGLGNAGNPTMGNGNQQPDQGSLL